MQELKTLILEFKKNPLPTFCGLLVAAVVYLVFMLLEAQNRIDRLGESYRLEIVATEKRCAKEMDDLRKEQISIIQAALDAQKNINERIRSLKKR